MKPRLTVACSLIILITVVLAAVQPALVLGQSSGQNKVFLPLVQTPGQRGIPVLVQPEAQSATSGYSIDYLVEFKNDGPVAERFYFQILTDDDTALSGVVVGVNPASVIVSPKQESSVRVVVYTGSNTPAGTDRRILRASAGSVDSPFFSEVTLTTNVTLPPPLFPTQFQNGDFESGPANWDTRYWEEFPDDIEPLPVIRQGPGAYRGDWHVVIGGPPDSSSSASQRVSISSDRPYLSYWYKIESGATYCFDEGPTRQYDVALVELQTLGGLQLVNTLYNLCQATDTNGQWIHVVVDLRAYTNQDVEVNLFAVNEARQEAASFFHLDNIEFVASP